MSKHKRRIVTSIKPVNTADEFENLHPMAIEEYGVYAWSPGLADEGVPATQVHVKIVIKNLEEYPLVLRFKSAEELDLFITTLQMYRLEVWGKREKGE